MLVQHYILSRSRYFKEVCTWLESRSVELIVHLNRCRFSIDSDSSLYTEFLLRYASICPTVDPLADLATGLNMNASFNMNDYVKELMEEYAEIAAKEIARQIDQRVLEELMRPKNK